MQSSLSERLLCSALRRLRKSMNVIEALPTLRQRYRHPKPRTTSSSGSLSRPFGSVCWTSKNGKCNTFSGVVRIGSWKFYFSKVAASELQSGCQGTATCADGRCQAVPRLGHEPLHHSECYSNDGLLASQIAKCRTSNDSSMTHCDRISIFGHTYGSVWPFQVHGAEWCQWEVSNSWLPLVSQRSMAATWFHTR
jgi:hypothetical protein